MRRKVVRNHMEFTVLDNNDSSMHTEAEEEYGQEPVHEPGYFDECPYDPGEKIIDLIVGTKTETIYYGGLDDNGRPMLLIESGILTCPVGMDINRQTVSELYADYNKLDIYKVTKANKSFFYEAASDMNEKADLYRLLGAKIETAYKYKRAGSDDRRAY